MGNNIGDMAGSGAVGWKDKNANDPEVVRLREHLAEKNGLEGIDTVKPDDLERAVELFHRDGFVVVTDVLNDEQIETLASGCNEVINEILALDDGRSGNRGSHRYSFGGSSMTRSQLHRPEWQMLLDLPIVHRYLQAIFGGPDYTLRAASGDFCLPGALQYQPLHSDAADWQPEGIMSKFSAFHDPRGLVSVRDLPCPYLCINFIPQDITRLNGPIRQVVGTQNSPAPIPSLEDEPEWMRLSTVCPVKAGAMMIRDVRAWHGGTPNVSDTIRSIPNLEFYAPWFREPTVPGITYADFKKLSPQAQRCVRFSVADSSETLDTGVTMRAP